MILLAAAVLWASLSAEARRRPRPRPKAKCDSRRYSCTGKRPADYDKAVRASWRPLKGYDRGCLKRIKAAGIRYRLLRKVKGVKTPVEITSKFMGRVRYRKSWNNKRRFILNCRMVEVLASAGPTIRKAGVATIYFSSSWRYSLVAGTRRLSKHASGEALDITAIDGAFGYASVLKHYEKGRWGCGNRNRSPKGKAWRKLFCALRLGRKFFRNVMTPDTDRNHRDHLHVELPNPRVSLPSRKASTGRRRRR